ncbi:Trafficking protein particle complex subunit 11 [Sparganum proliferum]
MASGIGTLIYETNCQPSTCFPFSAGNYEPVATKMEDIEKIPQELQLKPKCLIYLTGLEVETNHSHASVWKGFSQNRRSDRAPLKFRNVPVDHQYPKSNVRPSHYEWYQAKGLLKRKWMRKHLDELPAVVAIFFDLEWDEKQWQEKLNECARRVETVRSNLQSRDSKVVVVLLQKRAPVPVGDDLNATERAQDLCSRCQLPVKHLFVLQLTGFMFGCITRLETEMHDMASNYYHNAAKRVKSHRTNLNKANHQLLFVRHEFKIAFFDELKQDQNLALKHYRQAYNNLLELRVHELHLLEVKVVAGFINYKICRLFFQLQASESIAQFRRHIEFFTNLVGMPELAFEHEAWLSKQFEVFGELFDDATRFSVNPLLTQHPGLYYQEAARHTEARRRLALRLCQPEEAADPEDLDPTALPSSDRSAGQSASPGSVVRVSPAPQPPAPPPADSLTRVAEFYGQRPWRRSGHTLDVADPIQERKGIRFAQANEARVVHSNLIIPLLACACRYFERYKAFRMKLYPAFAIAEEYLRKEDYENALSQYAKVIEEFRSGNWSLLFTSASSRLFECARKVGNHVLSVSSALELLGPHSTLSEVEKLRIQELVFQDVDILQVDWNKERQDDPFTETTVNRLSVDATHLRSCIDVRAEFLKPSFAVDEPVHLLIYMKSFAPLPLTVHSAAVKLIHRLSPSGVPLARESEDVPGVPVDGSHSVYTTRCEWPVPLQLLSSDCLKAICFNLDPQILASSVQVESLEITLLCRTPDGQREKCTVTWSMLALAPNSAETMTSPTLTDRPCDYTARVADFKSELAKLCTDPPSAEKSLDFLPKWDHLANRSVARISPRDSKLELNLRHCPPVLCNEEYAVLCCVQNTEPSEISSLVLTANLSERGSENSAESVAGQESQATAADQSGFVVLGQYQAQLQRKSAVLTMTGASLLSEVQVSATLAPESELVCPLFLRCASPGDRSLRVNASYSLRIPVQPPQATLFTCSFHKKADGTNGCFVESSPLPQKPKVTQSITAKCIQSKRVQLTVLPPFDLSWRILSLQHSLINTVILDKPFVLEASLRNASPWDIEIRCAKPILGPGVDFMDGRSDEQLANICLQSSEVATGVQVLIVLDNSANADFVNLGHYVVRWRRLRPHISQDPSFPESSFSQIDLKPLSCPLADLPFNVELQMPAQAQMHTPLLLKYTLENKTSFLQELTVSMDSVPSFMFCGRQLVFTRLLPNSSQQLDFTLLPLKAGYLELPRFSVRSGERAIRDSVLDPTAAADLARTSAKDRMLRQLRSHIFVLPHRQVSLTGH